jgi:hypothetical protein
MDDVRRKERKKKIEKLIPDWPCPCKADAEYFRQ